MSRSSSSRIPGAAIGLAALLLTAVLSGRQSGVLPGELGVPTNVTRALPSCGACHSPQPNANGRIALQLTTNNSVAPGSIVPATVRVTGGPAAGFGFCLDTDRGSFLAGTGTRAGTAGNQTITHTVRGSGTWTFMFQAPAAPGLVQWHAVGQSVNGDGGTSGDSFGFFGPDSSIPGTAYHVFVNGAGVTSVGSGCAGTDGHVPIMGAVAGATRGQGFTVQVHEVAPGAVLLVVLGYSVTSWAGIPLPLDLAAAGASGCSVLVNLVLLQAAQATGSGSGNGSAAVTWPLPADPLLVGATVASQAIVLDPAANALGLATSNAVRSTVQ